ncbi:carboxylating nicotinate-nucleotide diphosphorylase [soil metagenome]
MPEETVDPNFLPILELALQEDLGTGDITSECTVSPDLHASAVMVVKQEGVVFGLDVARSAFWLVDPAIVYRSIVSDGSRIDAGTPIVSLEGSARSILRSERVALNFLQRLSGVATMTASYVNALRDCKTRVVDTRKTTPGMRVMEKKAVVAGGGSNHRFGLSDGVLIKDNHIAAVGGYRPVFEAVRAARAKAPHTLKIEIEVSTIGQLHDALDAGADIVMLDNMPVNEIAQAVKITAGRALLEASGGITLDNLSDVARTGVDFISIGALTHSAAALDISLDFVIS